MCCVGQANMIFTTGSNNVVLFSLGDDDLLEKSVKELFEEVTKTEIPPGTKYLQVDVVVTEKEDLDVEIGLPPVRLRLC